MNELQQGLLIAAIGMGLVFAVIIFLWGLMALMMRLTSRQGSPVKSSVQADDTTPPVVHELEDDQSQRHAAAAAVAVGLALAASQGSQLSGRDWETSAGPNPWQAFHRTRQMENKTK